jgi:hypothetical protein
MNALRWFLCAVALLISALSLASPATAHGAHQRNLTAATAVAGDSRADAAAPTAIRADHETIDFAAFASSADVRPAIAGNCPADDERGQANHPGCCAGISHCASGCTGLISPSVAPLPLAPRISVIDMARAPANGITTIPDEPPPRSSV